MTGSCMLPSDWWHTSTCANQHKYMTLKNYCLFKIIAVKNIKGSVNFSKFTMKHVKLNFLWLMGWEKWFSNGEKLYYRSKFDYPVKFNAVTESNAGTNHAEFINSLMKVSIATWAKTLLALFHRQPLPPTPLSPIFLQWL
jgi:hypothetical protein